MFLSRVEVAWSAARNPYYIHKRIWNLFTGEPKEMRREKKDPRNGFLFRIEASRPGKVARLLVQSRRQPAKVGDDARVIGTKEFNPQPYEGQILAFLVTANPIKTINDKDGRLNKKGDIKKCRVPLIKEDQQTEWLSCQMGDAADVKSVKVRSLPRIFFLKKGEAGKLAPVEFEGILRVKDPKALVTLLENGIGPAKAFGCGLMLVRQV